MSLARDIDVALVTEGTYPFHHGGVSVWCDQLVRGLPDQRFASVAIAGDGNEQPAMALPDNLVDLQVVPLWGRPSRGRRARGNTARAVGEAHDWLLSAITESHADPEGEMLGALGRMHELSATVDVGAELRAEGAARRVVAALAAAHLGHRDGSTAPASSLGDALVAGDLLEHFLRPLWAPPPRAGITHCVSNGLAALVGMSAKWSYGTPMVLAEHGVYLRERYLANDAGAYTFPVRAFVLRFFRILTGASYRVADLITPVCTYNERWQRRSGAAGDSIKAVHNGVDVGRFRTGDTEPTAPTLVWVGRVDPLKDLETLIRAFRRVRDAIPDARLRLFGPTPAGNEGYAARCRALIDELGLRDSAVFEGAAADVATAYQAGHVVVLSSVSEGFPYTVIEAMASGRATVSTDVGGVREAVGESGRVVAPRDPDAMASACIELLSDEPLRVRMAKRARRRIVRRFTLARFLGAYREIYADLVVAPDGRRTAALAVRSEVELSRAA